MVLLDGTVDCAATAEAIGGLVWDVPGVEDVRNSLARPRRAR
ncbi:BON domain-containing protein [Virgisporangium ochraceum]|nr:BON domain-containing protein [Virgisporangium ochraceum]